MELDQGPWVTWMTILFIGLELGRFAAVYRLQKRDLSEQGRSNRGILVSTSYEGRVNATQKYDRGGVGATACA
jgi:hypothetical protein